MNCRSAESLFSSYIEDEISQVERRDLEAHLLGCRRCSVAMRDVMATMSILQKEMPLVEPSAHFDEDVYARVRSGEGLRPSFAELARELVSPARLRPIYLAGAGACAVAAAFLISPMGHVWMRPAGALSSATQTREPAPSVTVAPPAISTTQTVAEQAAPASGTASSKAVGSVVASVSRDTPAVRDSILDGGIPRQRYKDEIINDRFFLESGRQGQDPSIVPVNETKDDGVYIIF